MVRSEALPPPILALPFQVPDWRVIGASPARLATSLPLIVPSSGIDSAMAVCRHIVVAAAGRNHRAVIGADVIVAATSCDPRIAKSPDIDIGIIAFVAIRRVDLRALELRLDLKRALL